MISAGSTNPTTITLNANKTVTVTFVAGGTVTFQEGVNHYAGTADTHIKQAAPTTSFGSETFVLWDTEETTGNANTQVFGLLRFDNVFGAGAGQIPVGSTIISATLRYVVSNNTANAPSSVNEVLVDWTEATTYNTFGSTAGVQAGDYGILVTTAPATAMTVYTISVTSSLAAWSNSPSSNRGWIIKPAGTDGVQIASSENATAANRPKLTVIYTTVPPEPPATPAGLSATAGVGTQIALAWTDNSSNESSFEIERSTDGSSGTFSLLTAVGANVTTYTDSGLNAGAEYCYRIRATNAGGDSSLHGHRLCYYASKSQQRD